MEHKRFHMARQEDFNREELSSKTLELMLFREMITNQDFLSRLSGVIDFRWFRTPHIRLMAEFAMLFYKKYGGVLTRDLVESLIQKRNDAQTIDANKVDLNTALYDFNKAKELDLGPMDENTKIAKIQAYVKQEAMRNALLDSATDLEQANTDGIIESTLKKFEDIQKILFEKVDLGVEMSKDEVEMAVGEPFDKTRDAEGNEVWMYARSNDVILDVWFNEKGFVIQAKARRATDAPTSLPKSNKKKIKKNGGGGNWQNGTPLQ